jgi:hypothetical protein
MTEFNQLVEVLTDAAEKARGPNENERLQLGVQRYATHDGEAFWRACYGGGADRYTIWADDVPISVTNPGILAREILDGWDDAWTEVPANA